MRYAIIVAALFLCHAAIAREPYITYDKFEGVTKIIGGAPQKEGSPGLTFLAVVKNKKLRELTMGVDSKSDEWRYLKCRSLAWLINGKRVVVGEPEYDGDVGYKGVYEHLYVNLSRHLLQQMSVASSIEYKVCNDEIAVTDEGLENIQDFALSVDDALR
ncbi:hypothetical protein [Dokdonella soli]|uniref:Uncharacterized protein n=1 Tax=Dokdonella soli TaxID=529810 RepID=A0ABP3TQA4_9GAMM